MKIGHKLYFMSVKLRKMQLIYPIFFLFFFTSPYSAIQRSVFYIYEKYYSYVTQPREIGRRTLVFWFLS